jgi:hypothetical protein
MMPTVHETCGIATPMLLCTGLSAEEEYVRKRAGVLA